jgi:molybdopterin molybdotransferase
MAVVNNEAVLSLEDARHTAERHAARLGPGTTEVLALLQTLGRVLAEPVFADRDFPPFHRATRDGYAVRSADLKSLPTCLEVVAEIKAGAAVEKLPTEIHPGQAAAIMTGAPLPPGTDAVVMVEYTSQRGNRVTITKAVNSGENVVPRGAEARRGDILLPVGCRLGPTAIGVAASVGRAELSVFVRPRVAVLSTGDEVVDINVQPGPSQIRNSNSYSLAAQVVSAGGEPVLLPVAPDELLRLRELIEAGLKADLLLLTGGVSMGKYDLVEQVLHNLGAEFFFTGAKIQPGRPVVFGRVHDKYFLGLPGNPVSTMVTFELFARPLVEALSGMPAQALGFVRARLKSEIKTKTGLTRFLPAIISGEFEDAEVELVRWQGSGDMVATTRSNCYVVVPPDREVLSAGEWVPVLLR